MTTALAAPGGLAASWTSLTVRQQNAALSLRTLIANYHGLATAMQPTTFLAFNAGLGLANSLLGPTAKLANSAGLGVASFLTQFTAHSGIQQFVSFLATQAGPAISLIGTDVTSIAHAIFALLQAGGGAGLAELKLLTLAISGLANSIAWLSAHAPGLTSVALSIGGIAFALSKLGALTAVLQLTGLSTAATAMTGFAGATAGATLAEKGMLATTTLLDAVSPVGWAVAAAAAIGLLVYAFSRARDVGAAYVTQLSAQDKATGFNIAGYQKLAGQLGTTAAVNVRVNDAIRQGSVVLTGGRAAWVVATTAQGNFATAGHQAATAAQNLVVNLGILQARYGITRTQAEQLAVTAGVSARQLSASGAAGQNALGKIKAYGDANVAAKRPVLGLMAAVTSLTNAMNANVIAVLTLQGDNIAWKQAQQAATIQLASNSKGLDGNSAKSLANQAAVLASTNAVASFAQHQLTLHGNLKLASQEIQAQIKWLQQHGDKSKFAAAEIAALRKASGKSRRPWSSSLRSACRTPCLSRSISRRRPLHFGLGSSNSTMPLCMASTSGARFGEKVRPAACGELLAPEGIAYVSYNCYPGCQPREMLRRMCQIDGGGIRDRCAYAAETVRVSRLPQLCALPPGNAPGGDTYRTTLREQAAGRAGRIGRSAAAR